LFANATVTTHPVIIKSIAVPSLFLSNFSFRKQIESNVPYIIANPGPTDNKTKLANGSIMIWSTDEIIINEKPIVHLHFLN